MYAIISAGSKQHRVSVGERLAVDLMSGKNNGDEIVFDQVLMLKSEGGEYTVGTPTISSASVTATVVDNGPDGLGKKGPKILVFKKKRRKSYARLNGHRQRMTHVEIKSISA